MKHSKSTLLVLVFLALIFSSDAQNLPNTWRQELQQQIQLLGHRNWILIVDAAYPLQSKQAIKTIVTNEKQETVVMEVLAAIDKAPHIYPDVFLDKEIDFVSENAANGVNQYRTNLKNMLQDKNVVKELHEDLIGMIDESAETFIILVLKTNMTIPYTSVFLRLNCGYWDEEAEKELRKKMSKY